MGKVDVFRFGDKLLKIFAPSIQAGQVFFAFTDEQNNSFTIQGDNLSSGSSDSLELSLAELQTTLSSFKDKISAKHKSLDDKNASLSDSIGDIQDQLDNLQNTVSGIQEASSQQGTSQSAGSSIIIVDDIVYGYHRADGDSPHLDFSNKLKLKCRPYLSGDSYFHLIIAPHLYSDAELPEYNIYVSEELGYYESVTFAGFEDGKIHTLNANRTDIEDSIVSTALNNGDFIMNKADNCVYIYDATNRKFIRTGGNQFYVVDYIADYIGDSLPNALSSSNVWIVRFDKYNTAPLLYMHQGYVWDAIRLQEGMSVASVQSIFGIAAIYTVIDEGNYLRAIHDLYNGDTIFNKADGYTYTFIDDGTSKSLIRNYTPMIEPVLDIVPIDVSVPDKPSAEGEKFLQFYPPESWWTLLYTATTQDSWDDGVDIQIGDRYASLTDHKIYEFKYADMANIDAFHYDVPVGVPFLNKADNCLYIYNGSDFVNINGT